MSSEEAGRIDEIAEQNETLAYIARNLVAITGALTIIVADLRAKASMGVFDPSLPDIEKDLKALDALLDKTWPRET